MDYHEFNVKAILVEEQQWYHLIYFKAKILLFSHFATVTRWFGFSVSENIKLRGLCNAKGILVEEQSSSSSSSRTDDTDSPDAPSLSLSLSLSLPPFISPYYSSLLAGLPDNILCPRRANVSKFLLVSRH